MDNIYDAVIIGGGPAGLTAGLYASRARLKTLLIEKALCGGQILVTDVIENFPGFPEGVKGPELAAYMEAQAKRFGLKTRSADALSVAPPSSPKGLFTIKTAQAGDIYALSVIIATGAVWNTLGVSGEKEFAGRGVSYCGTCDGPMFRGKVVIVVGGGDTAIEDGLFLTKFAKKVIVVHRRDRLRATKVLQERALAHEKMEFLFNSVVSEIRGDSLVRAAIVRNTVSGKEEAVPCDGVFIFVGMTPNSNFVKGVVATDEKGYILTDDDMRASCAGIFACGDVRKKTLRQVVTATGEGASAAFSLERYIDYIRGTEYK